VTGSRRDAPSGRGRDVQRYDDPPIAIRVHTERL
jgi:hypothetical protein